MDDIHYTKIYIVAALICLSNIILPLVYYYYRKKTIKTVSLFESLILLIIFFCAFDFCFKLSMYGGLSFDHITGIKHPYAIGLPMGYIVSVLALRGISIWNNEKSTYKDWLFWWVIWGSLFLINYFLGEYYFWHLYGPSPAHGGIQFS